MKARHFVLGLHDYYTGSLSATAPALGIIDSYSSFSTTTSDISVALTKPDRWALTYINIAHVQAILEAVDDDGTGFISVAEVNTFAASRPEGWTCVFSPSWFYQDVLRLELQIAALVGILECGFVVHVSLAHSSSPHPLPRLAYEHRSLQEQDIQARSDDVAVDQRRASAESQCN